MTLIQLLLWYKKKLAREYVAHQMIEKIAYGLKVAEREMLEEKARNNEDVIVCGDDNVIRHIPAKNFL